MDMIKELEEIRKDKLRRKYRWFNEIQRHLIISAIEIHSLLLFFEGCNDKKLLNKVYKLTILIDKTEALFTEIQEKGIFTDREELELGEEEKDG